MKKDIVSKLKESEIILHQTHKAYKQYDGTVSTKEYKELRNAYLTAAEEYRKVYDEYVKKTKEV